MTNQDAGEFFRRLAVLSELFQGQGAAFSDAKAELYFEALRDLSLPQVLRALNEAVRTCTFMPKPAELRTLAIGDDEDTTELAWQEYKRLARAVGGYGSPTFTDPALADAVQAVFGSWELACWSDFTPEMWASKRKEFSRVYRAMAKRNEQDPKTLPGFVERENRLHGWDRDPKALPAAEPVQIGAVPDPPREDA